MSRRRGQTDSGALARGCLPLLAKALLVFALSWVAALLAYGR